MKTLIAVIDGDNGVYGAWLENMEGVYGAGDTIADAKQNLLEGLALYIKHNHHIPDWLRNKQYKIVYKVESTPMLAS